MPDSSTRARAHLCLVQPRGYVHSLGLLDPLLFFRHHLENLGVEVTMGKNRLVAGAVNYVFGAHLGFDPAWLAEFTCVLVNLEQLGEGGAQVTSSYLRLLAENRTVDYHEGNLASYSHGGGTSTLVELGHAPYLDLGAPRLEDRPIDVLFFGSMLPRRRGVVDRLRDVGMNVVVPERPLYGPERDYMIRHARAVLNVSAYETSRFEQVRASLVLSAGTPLISERRREQTSTEARFAPFVHWFDEAHVEKFFQDFFDTEAYFATSRTMLKAWRSFDTSATFAKMWEQHREGRPNGATRQRSVRVQLGVQRGGYRPGWLNIGSDAAALPDVLVNDLWAFELPRSSPSARWPHLTLRAGMANSIDLGRVDPRSEDPRGRLSLARDLLDDDGRIVLQWPTEAPLDVLVDYTDCFWRSGSTDMRLASVRTDLLDDDGLRSSGPGGRWLRVVLRKQAVDVYDATVARAGEDDLELAASGPLG